MERYTLVRFAGKLTSCARNAHSKSQHTSGAMEEMSGKVQMQALTNCNAKIMSTRTAVGQFKGQSNGAMERYMRGFDSAKLTSPCHNTPPNSKHTCGAMEETCRQAEGALTYVAVLEYTLVLVSVAMP